MNTFIITALDGSQHIYVADTQAGAIRQHAQNAPGSGALSIVDGGIFRAAEQSSDSD